MLAAQSAQAEMNKVREETKYLNKQLKKDMLKKTQGPRGTVYNIQVSNWLIKLFASLKL